MITMYKIRWDEKIERVKVQRVTPTQAVLPSGKREALDTNYYSYFETQDAALDFLVKRCEDKVARLTCELEIAKAKEVEVRDYVMQQRILYVDAKGVTCQKPNE